MTDARTVAIKAIVRIDEEGAYANVMLPKVLEAGDLDARDRGFVTELVYGSTRRRRALDHVVDRYLVQPPPPTARAALRIGAHQLLEMGTPPHAAVSATVGATPKRFRGLVNAVLRKVANDMESGIEYPDDATALSYPDWIVRRLRCDLGPEAADAALRTMNEPATVHRRDDGYVQDPSSQLVAAAVPVEPGHRVLDLCAAPGGKSTALAARGACVVAADLRGSRTRLVAENRDRLGYHDLHVVVADGRCAPFRAASFDTVLVDAPCSGLGALRRRPDARWRIQEEQVESLAVLQEELLGAAASLVRPGGTLVYSVCTLTARETTGVVAALAGAPALEAFELRTVVEQPWLVADGVATVLPDADRDGMALAAWHRR